MAAERPPPPKGLSGPRAPLEREPAAPPDPRVPRAPPGSRPEVPLERSLAQDPLSCVRPFASDRRAAEIAGVFASTLAIGNTTSIRRAFARLLDRTGGTSRPGSTGQPSGRARRELGDFRHRWIRGDQLGYLAVRLRSVYAVHASLEDVFLSGMEGGQGFEGGLDALAGALRSAERERAIAPRVRPPVPEPRGRSKSPCKRLTLFVRWMVRSEYPTSDCGRACRPRRCGSRSTSTSTGSPTTSGSRTGRTRSWKTIEEVTEALRAIDPIDPVRYDFVLCHTGILRGLPETPGHGGLRAVFRATRLSFVANAWGRIVSPYRPAPSTRVCESASGPPPPRSAGSTRTRSAPAPRSGPPTGGAIPPAPRTSESLRVAHLNDEDARVEVRSRPRGPSPSCRLGAVGGARPPPGDGAARPPDGADHPRGASGRPVPIGVDRGALVAAPRSPRRTRSRWTT